MTNTKLLAVLVGVTLLTTLTTVAFTEADAQTPIPTNCRIVDYKVLESASAVQQGNSALKLSVDTCDTPRVVGEIPRFADKFINGQIVFGYAWLDTSKRGILTGVVAAIHPTFDDSNQNPNAWHTHTVVLHSLLASTSDFCIASLGTSQGGISIHQDVMNLNIAENQAGVNAEDLDLAASFTVVADNGCRGSGLGVDVISTATISKPRV